MNENENLVTTEVTENVEQTTEETPQVKTYTQDEVDAIVGKRIARKEAKIRKEYDRKYGELEEVLKAGTNKEKVEDMTDTFRQFYQSKGINVPQKPSYSDSDISVLAKADAEDIISGGYEEVVEEVDRLAKIGANKMTAREKALFKVLAEHRNQAEKAKELSQMGVTEDVYNSGEFKEFAAKFNPGTPIKDIYSIYSKTQPKKEVKNPGSMKNIDSGDSGIKEFYSRDEALKFSREELRKNPALMQAIENSMTKWK